MSNLLREYVDQLRNEEKVLIITGYEAFERDGQIGDEPLRLHAEAFIRQVGASDTSVVEWMRALTFECYRHFAKAYLQIMFNV